MKGLGLLKLPDAWQHQAVEALRAGCDVVLSAPTGAGKTYVFELLWQHRAFGGQMVYTVPTRALANEKYAQWQQEGWPVGIATGDLAQDVDAPVLVATLETQLESLIRGEGPALLVIDEYQMVADAQRGAHYEAALALAPLETRLLLLSGSVANAPEVAQWLQRLGRRVEVVATEHRPVPLEETPWEVLPQRLSRQMKHFWPQMVAAVLMADLAPLLIFSPRRRDAESIAHRLAADLPAGEPLVLSAQQRALCGRQLAALLERRIAYHHSGLSYAVRAGVIEPLAKVGALRVVVATMGLAAGINFSVRSVHVAAVSFYDAHGAQQKLAPDDLLQMYGRAGRRGLDERGDVITSKHSPSLRDARAARLHRSSRLAWPIFLRIMKHAALAGRDPFAAAQDFAQRLFAKTPPPLGHLLPEAQGNLQGALHKAGAAWFGLEASETQMQDSQGQWVRAPALPAQWLPLAQTRCWQGAGLGHALSDPQWVAQLAQGLGRVCRLGRTASGAPCYGLEIALGQIEQEGLLRPTRSLRRLLGLPKTPALWPLQEVRQSWATPLAEALEPIWQKVMSAAPRMKLEQLPVVIGPSGQVHVPLDLSQAEVPARGDAHGVNLYPAPTRQVAVKAVLEQEAAAAAGARAAEPAPGSALHAWRALGLMDAKGVPTRRGEIFSFFQGGEGLAVVAALEDEGYAIADLVLHLANLRGGNRFDLGAPCDSERLAAVCRNTFGFVQYEGYLHQGLPPDYGEGAAEVLSGLWRENAAAMFRGSAEVAAGDVSRAYVEWLSLLRHITHAPRHPWPRWQALQEQAKAMLKQHGPALRHLFALQLPPLTQAQRRGKVRFY